MATTPGSLLRRLASLAVAASCLAVASMLVATAPAQAATTPPDLEIAFDCHASFDGISTVQIENVDGKPHDVVLTMAFTSGSPSVDEIHLGFSAPGALSDTHQYVGDDGFGWALQLVEDGVVLVETPLFIIDSSLPGCWKEGGPADFPDPAQPVVIPPTATFTADCGDGGVSRFETALGNPDDRYHEVIIETTIDGVTTSASYELFPGALPFPPSVDVPVGSVVQVVVKEGAAVLATSEEYEATGVQPDCFEVAAPAGGGAEVPGEGIDVDFAIDCAIDGGAVLTTTIASTDGTDLTYTFQGTADGVLDGITTTIAAGEPAHVHSFALPPFAVVHYEVLQGGVVVAETPHWLILPGAAPCFSEVPPYEPGDGTPTAPTIDFTTECEDGGVRFDVIATNQDGGQHFLVISWEGIGQLDGASVLVLPSGEGFAESQHFLDPGDVVSIVVSESGDVLATALFEADEIMAACGGQPGGDPEIPEVPEVPTTSTTSTTTPLDTTPPPDTTTTTGVPEVAAAKGVLAGSVVAASGGGEVQVAPSASREALPRTGSDRAPRVALAGLFLVLSGVALVRLPRTA